MTAAAKSAPAQVQTLPMTRREFLYYIWGASLALATAESTGAIIWFLIPRFREGEFGGIFQFDLGALPGIDAGPLEFPDGRFWLVNLGDASLADSRLPADYPERAQKGVLALYKVCVHLGCLYKWVPTNDRFECPCHGSKYLTNGVRIDGPARRNLDVLVLQALDASGNVLAETDRTTEEGSPIELPEGTTTLSVNTGQRVQGAFNAAPGGGR